MAISTLPQRLMGLLQTPTTPKQNYQDQSERDLLITLSVKIEQLQHTINYLIIAIGVILIGALPLAIVTVLQIAAIVYLWSRP